MRVIFMGTPDFAVPTLDALVDAGHEIVLVVAQPDRPSGRGRKLRAPPVAVRATELGLPLAQPKALRSGPFPERYVGLAADVSVVIAYGRILPERLLQAPTHGCVNVHASLLPRWRGAAPIQHAIWSGDTVTGVCTQRMEPSLDTGPVYVREETPIGAHETTGQLHDRLAEISARVAVKTLEVLPTAEPEPQPEGGITWAPKISKEDGKIDFTRSASALDLQIRAMTPWPGGWVPLEDGQAAGASPRDAETAAGASPREFAALKIKRATPVSVTDAELPPGTLQSTDPLEIRCGEGALQLEEVQAPGRRGVRGADYARGLRLKVGDSLTRR